MKLFVPEHLAAVDDDALSRTALADIPLAATLAYTLPKGATVALEYSRLVRRENDKAADFKVDGLAVRFAGSF